MTRERLEELLIREDLKFESKEDGITVEIEGQNIFIREREDGEMEAVMKVTEDVSDELLDLFIGEMGGGLGCLITKTF